MRLFIAEKPSLGRAIADAFGGNKVKHGSPYPTHIELDNGDIISWAVGHLLEQAEPHDYDKKWNSWDIKNLPIKIKQWKMKPTENGKNQLAVLKGLMDKADVIINAGDPDREGQLIIDEIIKYFGFDNKPQLRIWLNAVDLASTKKALANMEDNKLKKYVDLRESALCRQRADWLVGMNMTRAVTKTIAPQGVVASIGRVQTPTLSLVVQRCIDIEKFVPKAFYDLEVDVLSGKDRVTLTFSTQDHDKRIWDRKEAEALAVQLQGRTVQLNVSSTEKLVNPPPLFHLPDFQKFASLNMKWGVEKSLNVLQLLYEAKLTSYPRTESNKLPPEQEPDGLPIGKGLISTGLFPAAKGLPLSTRKAVYSCSKDEPHHAIVPTQVLPKQFPDGSGSKNSGISSADTEIAWKIIANRFLMSLLPSYRYTETVIWITEEKRNFSVKGEVPLTNPAKTWLALSKEQRKSTSVPGIKDKATGVIQEVRILNRTTSKPDYYTEATLLDDMRSVAKFVTNDKLKAILKETSGIGTAATQAAIIERIKKQGYVYMDGQKLLDTPLGRSLILALPSQLKDPCLTAAWEDALKMMASGGYSPQEFMSNIDDFVEKRLNDIFSLKGKVVLSADKTNKSEKVKTKTRRITKNKANEADGGVYSKRKTNRKQKILPYKGDKSQF